MKTFSAAAVAEIVRGKLVQGSGGLMLTDATDYPDFIKSPNTLYFWKGDWAKNMEAIRKYLPCGVVAQKYHEQLKKIEGCTVILVEDVENAYWDFAGYYRDLFDIPVIAVTGTSGKTTTKDMIMQILKRRYNVTGTYESSNGPARNRAYLLDMNEPLDAAVFETPVSSPGFLAYACRLFKPTIGIITNIGIDHTEGCKTQEGYIKAKAEMLPGLGDKGILIINADDENTKKIDFMSFSGRIVYFGIHSPSDFKGSHIRWGEDGMHFLLTFHHMDHEVFVPGYGEHQVYNALAALAAVHELGIGIDEGIEGLRSFVRLPHVLQLLHGIGGCTLMDDTWNFSPGALKGAIEVFNTISKGRKRVIILGSIHELGDMAAQIHRQAGDTIMDMGGFDILITIGSPADEISKRAKERGAKGEIYTFPGIGGIFDLLKNRLDENTIVLLKFEGLRDKSILDLIKDLKV